MTSIAGIVFALALLLAFAYRGVSVLILAPICASIAVLFSPGTPLFASYTQVFMAALGGFVVAFFPLFLLGAIFGKLMEASGAASAIAQHITRRLGSRQAVLSIVVACGVLTYGGVSLFVVAFAVFPIAAALFCEAQIPKRLIPATIALGAFTFTMTALPGTPAIQNAIPMPYFGTTLFAAPGLGFIGGALMLALGWWWLDMRASAARRCGEGYGPDEAAAGAASMPLEQLHRPPPPPVLSEMSFATAITPVLLVIVLNYVLTSLLWPALDTSYLAGPRYGPTTALAVRGIWGVIGALGAAIIWLTFLWWLKCRAQGFPPNLKSVMEEGANSSVMPLLNTASQVGFGAVVASLAGFSLLRDAVLGIAPNNPLVSISFAVNILAGITGSASGGMSIALQTLGATWSEMGRAAGIAPDLLHRVTAIATGGLDALPHNGAVITLLGICKLTHSQSYLDIFMVAVAFPLAALCLVVALGTMFGSF